MPVLIPALSRHECLRHIAAADNVKLLLRGSLALRPAPAERTCLVWISTNSAVRERVRGLRGLPPRSL
jgi:hypothetical protein